MANEPPIVTRPPPWKPGMEYVPCPCTHYCNGHCVKCGALDPYYVPATTTGSLWNG
jgi:hypothetical protein